MYEDNECEKCGLPLDEQHDCSFREPARMESEFRAIIPMIEDLARKLELLESLYR